MTIAVRAIRESIALDRIARIEVETEDDMYAVLAELHDDDHVIGYGITGNSTLGCDVWGREGSDEWRIIIEVLDGAPTRHRLVSG
jgi:uncharacterized protein (UPF0218 family)